MVLICYGSHGLMPRPAAQRFKNSPAPQLIKTEKMDGYELIRNFVEIQKDGGTPVRRAVNDNPGIVGFHDRFTQA